MLTLAEIEKRIKPFKGRLHRETRRLFGNPTYSLWWEQGEWELNITENRVDRIRFRKIATTIIIGLEAQNANSA